MVAKAEIEQDAAAPADAAAAKEDVAMDAPKGELVKKIITEGTGPCPLPGQQCEVHYTGTLKDGTQFDSSRSRGQTFKFNVGEGKVIQGWDEGVLGMKVGERAEFEIPSHMAYGAAGAGPQIPPNSDLNFDVELIDARDQPKDISEMSDEEKLKEGTEQKEAGNKAFKEGDLKKAIFCYKESIRCFEYSDNWIDDMKKDKTAVLKGCHLNLAQCYIKTEKWSCAKEQAELALVIECTNTKALFRLGTAHLAMGDVDDAKKYLNEALRLDGGNKEVRAKLIECKERAKAQKQKQKALYGNLFDNSKGLYGEKVGPKKPRDVTKLPKVWMDVKIGEKEPQRIDFALYDDTAPKSAENFRALCTGEKGNCTVDPEKPLHFENTEFHRIIPGFMAQGGDITKGNGTGGESIYGERFDDEHEMGLHDKPGLLSMANCGPNTNGSQFFITFKDCPHLDGKHIVFGEVLNGMDFVREMENVETTSCDTPDGKHQKDKPVESLTIVKCGHYTQEEWAARSQK